MRVHEKPVCHQSDTVKAPKLQRDWWWSLLFHL